MTEPPNPPQALLNQWREQHPVLAAIPPLPLALGVHKALQAATPGVSGTQIRKALRVYCGQPAYLRALAAPGAQRYNLNGNPVEPVSDEHQQVASTRLAQPPQKAKAPSKPATRDRSRPANDRQGKPIPAPGKGKPTPVSRNQSSPAQGKAATRKAPQAAPPVVTHRAAAAAPRTPATGTLPRLKIPQPGGKLSLRRTP